MRRTDAHEDWACGAKIRECSCILKFEIRGALLGRHASSIRSPVHLMAAFLRGCRNGYAHLAGMENADTLRLHGFVTSIKTWVRPVHSLFYHVSI